MNGKISQLTDTCHAVSIAAGGIRVLIHVAVDTVDRNRDGFQAKVKLGQRVKKGDQLLEINLDKIQTAGHPAVAIPAVTNSDDFSSVKKIASGAVQSESGVLKVSQ